MPILILAILTIIFLIISIWYFVSYIECVEIFAGVQLRKRKLLLASLLNLLFFISGISWWIYSAMQPLETSISTIHEIKEVSYPDGSKIQMAIVDGKHVNITSHYGKILDQEWVLRRVKFSQVYVGLIWPEKSEYYYLEKKE